MSRSTKRRTTEARWTAVDIAWLATTTMNTRRAAEHLNRPEHQVITMKRRISTGRQPIHADLFPVQLRSTT